MIWSVLLWHGCATGGSAGESYLDILFGTHGCGQSVHCHYGCYFMVGTSHGFSAIFADGVCQDSDHFLSWPVVCL